MEITGPWTALSQSIYISEAAKNYIATVSDGLKIELCDTYTGDT